MKILKNSINAAVQTAQNTGTIFYAVTLQQIIDYYSESPRNVWVRQAFIEKGWDALDLEHHLFGSAVIDDTLYICTTDCEDIIVNDEAIYPEDALETCTIDELSDYIKPADDKIINRYVSEYEIKTPDFNDWAITILNDGYDFSKMLKDCTEFDYFDFL